MLADGLTGTMLVREGFQKQKWKSKMAFAMKGRRGSRMPLTYFANAILNVFFWTNIMYGSNLLDLDLSSKYEKGNFI